MITCRHSARSCNSVGAAVVEKVSRKGAKPQGKTRGSEFLFCAFAPLRETYPNNPHTRSPTRSRKFPAPSAVTCELIACHVPPRFTSTSVYWYFPAMDHPL